MSDPIREAMKDKVLAKYDEGVREHGNRGLRDANLGIKQLMIEIQNEAIDTIAYTENVIQMIEEAEDAKDS